MFRNSISVSGWTDFRAPDTVFDSISLHTLPHAVVLIVIGVTEPVHAYISTPLDQIKGQIIC